MVFLSLLEHDGVTARLENRSDVDTSVPMSLDTMPRMPRVRTAVRRRVKCRAQCRQPDPFCTV